MAFVESEIKAFIRLECLREDDGSPRKKPDRVLRVLALMLEGGPFENPIWSREFEDGENDEDVVDVDGISAKIRKKVETEVTAKAATVMFRLVAVHGALKTISGTTVTAQHPFTVHPTRRVKRDADDDGSGYQRSFKDATPDGLNAHFMRAMQMTSDIYFPEISNLLDEKNTTITQLRGALQDANDTIDSMRTKLADAEDRRVDRTIKLRDAAVKQRLKERGGRLVMNTLTMIASSYMAGKQIGSGAGPAKEMSGGSPEGDGNGGSGGNGGGSNGGGGEANAQANGEAQTNGEGAPSAEGSSAAAAAPAVDVIAEAVTAVRGGGAFNLDLVFGALLDELVPHMGELAFAISPDQQAMIMQMVQIYNMTGKADRLLLQRFGEDLGEDGDTDRLKKLMAKMPSKRAQAGLALVLTVVRSAYDQQKKEETEMERDIGDRIDRQTSGEVLDEEPIVPENLVDEIEVRAPRMVTRKEAEEARSKRRDDVRVTQSSARNDKKRPL